MPDGLLPAWSLRRTWALPLRRSGSASEPLVVALALSLAWCASPERPDLRAAPRRMGLCAECRAVALPPPAAAPPAPRKLAARTTPRRGG